MTMKILQRITAFFTALILLNCPAPAFSAETGNSEDASFLSGGFVVPGWGLIVIAGCLIFLSGTVVYGGIRFRRLTRFGRRCRLHGKMRLAENFLLNNIMDNLPAIVAVKDASDEFRYLIWNRMAEKITGIPAGDIIGKTDAELNFFRGEAEIREEEAPEILNGKTLKRNSVITALNGIRHDIDTLVTGIGDDDSRLLLILGIDVSEEKRLAAERKRLQDDLQMHTQQERLFSSILESVSLAKDEDKAIRTVLQTLGQKLNAELCYVYSYDYERNLGILGGLWNSDRAHDISHLPPLKIDPDAIWFRRLKSGCLIAVDDLSDPDMEIVAGNWRKELHDGGLKSICVAGIWKQNRLWGHFGVSYDRANHHFDLMEQRLIQVTTHVIEIILACRDTRTELERSEFEKRIIMDTVHIPITLFSPDLKLVRANSAALKLAAHRESEIYGHECHIDFCGAGGYPENCPVKLAASDLKAHQRQLKLNGRDYLESACPAVIQGKPAYILRTMIDMTDFNETQRQLARALTEAENANKAKSLFLATMSHELRTPLNAVIGFSELLQNNDVSHEELMDYLHSINVAGNTLLTLINDILDLSKIEAEQMKIVPEPTDLRLLAGEFQAIFKQKVEEKGLFLKIECPQELPVVKIDSLRVRQILLNLIGNAVKYTRNGGITVTFGFLKKDGCEGTLRTRVADTGIGILSDAQKEIFNPFIQQDAVRDSRIYNGTGLGLAISQRLAERMGGRILLRSELGKGSVFTLELEHVPYIGNAAEGISGKLERFQPVEVPQWHVLLADDVALNLKVLSAMFRKLHIKADTVSSGGEVLEYLKTNIPDILLTDLWMPGMNGENLAREIRANPAYSKMKIFAVTADTDNQANFNMELFDGILLKPVTLEKLNGLLARMEKQDSV